MDSAQAMEAFAALSQETRLKALRILVEYGHAGIAAGALAERLQVPANTLSFHLAHLQRAGLVQTQRNGRQIIYAADIAAVQALGTFLLEDCCIAQGTAQTACCEPKKENGHEAIARPRRG